MKGKKRFAAAVPEVATTPPVHDDAAFLVIPFPENPSGVRTINLTPWLGHGIDEWVWACAGQLRAFLAGGKVTPSTIACYWTTGFTRFFAFLVASGEPCSPQFFEPKHVRHYIGWIKEHHDWAAWTHRSYYNKTKSVLVALRQRRLISDRPNLFPANPFPKRNIKSMRAAPLSRTERQRLASALRDDLVAIHEGQFKGANSAALVVHVLALAIRTGLNSTPLLEMSRDCLRPHPFMPNMMLLETFKRRGNAIHLKNLRFFRQGGVPTSISLDGVAL